MNGLLWSSVYYTIILVNHVQYWVLFLNQSRQSSGRRDKRLREIIFTMMLISQGIRHDNQEVFLTNINLFYHVATALLVQYLCNLPILRKLCISIRKN